MSAQPLIAPLVDNAIPRSGGRPGVERILAVPGRLVLLTSVGPEDHATLQERLDAAFRFLDVPR